VAQFAAIFVRRRLELAAVGIGVAVRADQLSRFVGGILARGLVAEVAFELAVLAFELERALLVHLACEQGGLELDLVMAGVAVRAGRAARELAPMNVFMAIAAQGMRHRRPEIVILMALRAGGVGVFAMQREFGFGVIKIAGRKNRLPAGRGMAILA